MDFDLIRVVAPWLAMMSATIPREQRCIQTGRKVLRNVLLSRDCLPRILSSPSVGHSRSARTGIQPLPQDVQAAQALLCRLLDRTYRHNREPPVPPSFGLLSHLPILGLRDGLGLTWPLRRNVFFPPARKSEAKGQAIPSKPPPHYLERACPWRFAFQSWRRLHVAAEMCSAASDIPDVALVPLRTCPSRQQRLGRS